ncbi:MAG: hypothetical protein J1F43_02045 [Muribaculaceae bacterium]|nr:hypothetical protein [Muribaculaceae bacterium]
MSRNSYTASERRGIVAIAIVALLIIALGLITSWCGRSEKQVQEIPEIVEHTEMIDTAALRFQKEKAETKSQNKKFKGRKTSTSKEKSKKTYRRRSPLDEPV